MLGPFVVQKKDKLNVPFQEDRLKTSAFSASETNEYREWSSWVQDFNMLLEG
jgi:hypothetical protein